MMLQRCRIGTAVSIALRKMWPTDQRDRHRRGVLKRGTLKSFEL